MHNIRELADALSGLGNRHPFLHRALPCATYNALSGQFSYYQKFCHIL
jgi:hypothetical protein